MEHLNILAFAIPFFVGFMLLEYYVSLKKGKQYFHFEEAVANINVGIGERIGDLFTTGVFYFVFVWIHEKWAIFHIPSHIITWIILFLFTDFIWYWYHRLGHEINLFWSAHVVHHQSEDFNYTVSVRITVLQAFFRALFWSFLPLIGFSPAMTTVILLVHGVYPFFTHTRTIGKLGFLEYILVTPSHHRVHHSSNPEYLDKNYGDVLIIWDKLFGTFTAEKAAPVYGLTKPVGSYSFLWQHFHFVLEMAIAFKRAATWRERFKIIFGKPDDIDPRIRSLLEKKLLRKSSDIRPALILYRYIMYQTICTITILFFMILFEHYQTVFQLMIAAAFILISIISTGAMLEQRKWIFHLEYLRLGLICIYIYSWYPYIWLALPLIALPAFVLLYYNTIRTHYYKLLYQHAH